MHSVCVISLTINFNVIFLIHHRIILASAEYDDLSQLSIATCKLVWPATTIPQCVCGMVVAGQTTCMCNPTHLALCAHLALVALPT